MKSLMNKVYFRLFRFCAYKLKEAGYDIRIPKPSAFQPNTFDVQASMKNL